MATRWAVASGDFSNLAIWNSSASLGLPTASDDLFTNSFNVNINQSFSALSLNNAARARDIATPAMTANNTPSPYVAAASSVQNVSTNPYLAFDRNTGFTTYWQSAASTGWISMDFGSGSSTVIDGYTIYGYSGQTFNPRYWSLQGSNDNTSWTNLHIVSGAAAIANNGTYSVASIGNSTGYRYYRIDITLNGGATSIVIPELELYQPGTAALTAGGSFNFNSGSISGSATSTSPLGQGATNLITVTATTGSVSLALGGAVTAVVAGTLISHTGNCDLTLSGSNFNGSPGITTAACISKTSAGTINVIGNIIGGRSNNNVICFSSTNGNTIVNGNIVAGFGVGINGHVIVQTAGNITVNGNITGGTTAGSVNTTYGINFSGT